MTQGNVEIRTMTSDDISLGMELKNIAGWNQLPADWQRLLALEPDGCFVATCDGVDVGTATTTTYEDKFGWVAMVLVYPQYRRRGIGTALLYASIDYLEERVAAVKLDATPMGKKLYDTLGFVDEYIMERWLGRGREPLKVPDVEPITADLLPALCDFDRPMFGADRSRLLGMLVNEEPNTALCIRDGGRIVAYGILRPGYRAAQIGPLVGLEPQSAERVFQALLAAAGDQHIYNDMLLPNPHTAELLRKYGFEKQRYLIRMSRGDNRHPGHPQYIYAASGPAKG